MRSHEQISKESVEEAQRKQVLRRLYMATGLCSTFLIIEVIGGYLSGSLAVLSDAAHLFADLASFAIAIIANHLASLPATDQHTFGLKRSESLAALFSMLSLALVSLWLAAEAINRLLHSHADVDGKLMSGISAIGVLVNIALAFVLGVENHIHLPGYHGHDHSHGHDDGHCSSHDHADEGHAHNEKSEAIATSHGNDDSGCSSNNGHEHSHSHTAVAPEVPTEKTPLTSSGGHEHEHAHTTPAPVVAATETTALTSGHEHLQGHSNATCAGAQVDKSLPAKIDHHEAPLPRNVNLHAAYLHVLGDLAQSVAVLIAGLAIWYNPKWRIVDTISTLFFCSFVFYSTLGVLRSSIAVLLEEVPADINWRDMLESIQAVEGIENVHDLHIWSISHGQPTLSMHCSTLGDVEQVMEDVYSVIKKKGIRHATIQVQGNGLDCITCSDSPCDDKIFSAIDQTGSEIV